jgi:putative esterase
LLKASRHGGAGVASRISRIVVAAAVAALCASGLAPAAGAQGTQTKPTGARSTQTKRTGARSTQTKRTGARSTQTKRTGARSTQIKRTTRPKTTPVGETGLPADAPAALYASEPSLPHPAGWPGSAAFPVTSGTGRYDRGAFLWTNFMYSDNGAIGDSAGQPRNDAITPSLGTYTYPAGPADNDGADIFTAGVTRSGAYTYWLVGWVTLASPRVPIAEWTFDRGGGQATGSVWPASAGVSSPGIDTALVMSGSQARLIDVATGRVEGSYPVTVDMHAQTFVARIPVRALPASGQWKIRLAAGLADAAGTGFAPAQGALPGETAVYDVDFRTNAQEPPADNFWRDDSQATSLTTGNVSSYYASLDWNDVTRHLTTAQVQPTGWSDRWYVSTVDLGEGLSPTGLQTIADGVPEFLGRVQPYAIYVPTGYNGRTPLPLTLLLHSSEQNENQYGAIDPKFSQAACQDRNSICVTPLGRGPDGDDSNYWDLAELDVWQVWHDVSLHFRLDPTRTIISGYSLGGVGANQLAMEHPDLFSEAVTLAGGVGAVPQLSNLRWVPVYLAGGAADELVPVTQQYGEASALASLGYRYRWLVYPAADHVSLVLEDGFSDAAAYMDQATVIPTHPGRIDFAWNPQNHPGATGNEYTTTGDLPTTQEPALGMQTTGAYWLRDLAARSDSEFASITATSAADAEPAVTPVTAHSVLVPGSPSPAVATQQTWTYGAAPPTAPTIALTLTNVARVTVLTAGAGLRPGEAATLEVHSDGPAVIHLGPRHVTVGAGAATIRFRAAAKS